MGLARVDEERMAQVHIAGSAGGVGERAVLGGRFGAAAQFPGVEAGAALRLENPGHVQVGTGADTSRSVGVAGIGEKEQHEQGEPLSRRLRQ